MSNAVFPSLPGISWSVTKSPAFKTQTHTSVSGRELRATMQQSPLYTFSMDYEVLREGAQTELQQLVGFFLARQGSFDSFLFTDNSDCTATNQDFGMGDGTTRAFQLIRAYGVGANFAEPVQNVNTVTALTVGGVSKIIGTDYTVGNTGMVSFSAAPASGAVLAWTGTFYYRCRFVSDSAEFENFLKNLWGAKKIAMIGAPGNKV